MAWPLSDRLIRLDDMVKFLNEPSGKDRLFRGAIFVCRLAEWLLKKRNLKHPLAVRVKNLDGSLNSTRRVLRLGKILQFYQQLCLIPVKLRGNLTMMLLETGKVLSSIIYVVNDHAKWISSIGVLDINGEKYGYRSTCAWFSIIIFSLLIDSIRLFKSLQAEQELFTRLENQTESKDTAGTNEYAVRKSLAELYIARRFIYIELIKNSFDTPIAVIGVMKWKNNTLDGLIALLGIISSFLAVYSTWRKIVPWAS